MNRTTAQLRQVLHEEADAVRIDVSLAQVKGRHRRRVQSRVYAAGAAAAVVLLAVSVPVSARSPRPAADPLSPPGTGAPRSTAATSTTTTASIPPVSDVPTRQHPIRTGTALSDGGELVVWYEPGGRSLVLGQRDARTGAVTPFRETSAVVIDRVHPARHFDDTYYLAPGRHNTVILVSGITARLTRLTTGSPDHPVDVPYAQASPTRAVYWLAGLPTDLPQTGRFPTLRAYDTRGRLLETVP